MADKYPKMITPRGLAAYAWLDKKDKGYGGDPSKDAYKVTIVLDKKDMGDGRADFGKTVLKGAAWVRHLMAMCKEQGVPSKPGEAGCPIQDGDSKLDKDGNPKEQFKGKLLIQFKSKNYKPRQIDTKGNDLPRSVRVLTGDLIRVSFTPAYGKVGNKPFLVFYLDSVMLVEKLNEGGVDFGEEGEDGYVVPEDQRVVDYGEEEDESDDNSGDF